MRRFFMILYYVIISATEINKKNNANLFKMFRLVLIDRN